MFSCWMITSGEGAGKSGLIEALLQDGLEALVGDGLVGERPLGGSFHPLRRVGLCQAHHAQAGAVALLHMRLAVHDLRHQGGRVRPDGRRPS